MTFALRNDGSYFRPATASYAEPRGMERVLTSVDIYELVAFEPPRSTVPYPVTEVLRRNELATSAAATQIPNSQNHVVARLRMLRHLPAGYDGQGASAPNPKSIDVAIDFIEHIRSGQNYSATLDDDGSAVIEFEDRGTAFFADITFRDGGVVEMYKRAGNNPSEFFEGNLCSPEARRFLETYLDLVL